MAEPLLASAQALARAVREGEISACELLELHLAHIRTVNPSINALVVERFEQARREAKEADRVRLACDPEQLPPLHGVPCTIKECFAVAGMPQSAGLVARKSFRATKDASAVRRLKDAGAIIMGLSNTSELCMWMESYNHVYGRSRNPYNLDRIVGGSSGGEAALIGAGASPFGLGSDIGGSIRGPAFFNGVFGHKPSGGLVPGTGQHPNAEGEALSYLTTGPICRRAEDLMPLLSILAGPDGVDTACNARPLGDPATIKIDALEVHVVEDNGRWPVSAQMRAAQWRAADALAARGAQVKVAQFEGLRHDMEIWSAMLSAASDKSFGHMLSDSGHFSLGRELCKWLFKRSHHTFPALGLVALERLVGAYRAGTRRNVARGMALRDELETHLGPHGVMLYPPYPTVAPPHGKPLFPPVYWAYTAIMNVMKFPVTQVPLGLSDEGLPLGVQVAAVDGNDHVTIAVALALEESLGGWTWPPRIPYRGETQ